MSAPPQHRDRRWPRRVYAAGSEPDPRFTFANERTFLAWIRTGLGFLAAGVAIAAVAQWSDRLGLESAASFGRPGRLRTGLRNRRIQQVDGQ